jgi:hypothetical protein
LESIGYISSLLGVLRGNLSGADQVAPSLVEYDEYKSLKKNWYVVVSLWMPEKTQYSLEPSEDQAIVGCESPFMPTCMADVALFTKAVSARTGVLLLSH